MYLLLFRVYLLSFRVILFYLHTWKSGRFSVYLEYDKINFPKEMKAVKEEMAEEPFVIRPYLKSELAHLYNPYVPLVYAMRKMREWIRNNKELYDAMYSGGEGKNDHAYSARQVRLIVKYLDEP